MLKFIDYEDKKYLLVSSFFISLACMTRYVGIFALISFLSLLIFKAKEDIVKKKKERNIYILVYLFFPTLPMGNEELYTFPNLLWSFRKSSSQL
ncbi:hypothetical protein J8C01_08175 [Chloracidobacterium sp. D]|nr:hypothetical protein J8C01_08175 [Chloracidobacterium sp. D]